MLFTRDQLHFRHQLSHQQIDDLLDEKISPAFPESKAASLAKLDQFLKITDLLTEHSIRFITLKGPILSQKIYNDATYRTIGDFDFLLGLKDIENAISILKKHGFETSDWPDNESSIIKRKKYRNQVLLEHPGTSALVEFHWRLFEIPPINRLTVEKIVNDNLEEMIFASRKFVTLNAGLELLYLVIHGGNHNWFRIKWLEDVRRIAAKGNFNTARFKELVNLLNAQRMVALCNAVISYIYPGDKLLPEAGKVSSFAVRFTISRIHAEIYRPYQSVSELIQYCRFILTTFPGIYYKIRVARFIFYSFSEKSSFKSLFAGLIFQPKKSLMKRYMLPE